MKDNRNRHLKYLNNLKDYKVAKDNPDVRGWPLLDADKKEIGKIENFLVDMDAEAVRYLEVSIKPENKDAIDTKTAAGGMAESHTIRTKNEGVRLIVPIGLARINREDHNVYTDSINTENYRNLPVISQGETPTEQFERDLVNRFTGNSNRNQEHTSGKDPNQLENESQKEDVFYGQECFDQECFFESERYGGRK